MKCPNCREPIDTNQNFCRECGAELIAAQPSHVRLAGVVVLAVIFVGLLVGIGGKMFEMRWLSYLGLVVMFTGSFVIGVYAFLKETRPRRRANNQIDTPTPAISPAISDMKADPTNKLLPLGEDDYIPSVAEDTTELLQIPAKR